MALTRSMLKAMPLTEEQVEEIIVAHTETVTGLKTRINDLETALGPLKEVAKERDGLKDQLAKAGDSTKLRAEFDAYKQQVENEKQEAKITEEVTAICKEAGIARDSFLRAVGREFDRSKIQRDKDGAISNRAELVEYVKKDFADFGSTTTEKGVPPVTPPAGGGAPLTRESIMKIEDTPTRQKLIRENINLFST